MNLRNYGRDDAAEYNIGLDLGTASVGWAVVDDVTNEIPHFKGKPAWGSRVYPSADTAQDARANRGMKRRIIRRRNRLNLLQQFFAEEMAAVDPDFFTRLNHSYLVPEDREFGHPLFNASDFTESEYYRRFPTIFHLRRHLMQSDEKEDIRLVYLALHNIVKARGNFLYQENKSLSAKNANMTEAVSGFKAALLGYLEYMEGDDFQAPAFKEKRLKELLEKQSGRKSEIAAEIEEFLGLGKEYKALASNIAKAIVGLKADFGKVFPAHVEDAAFYMSEDEKTEAYRANLDDEAPLFDAITAMYSASVLIGILKGGDGETISSSKIAEYEQYGADLRELKQLIREYKPELYDEFFRGELYEDKSGYDKNAAKGYTKYNLDRSQSARDSFFKEIKKAFQGTAAEGDSRYIKLQERIAEDTYLKRLKTSSNGVIPYQLHLEEMDAIIDAQSKFYPFLADNKDKLESLVSFRIPYYVGPLTTKNARRDAQGRMRFAWSVRNPGMEDVPIRPWNFDEVIDKDASAAAFMNRMIGTCTYLLGEQVLPKCSLTYEMYCVLNELNGAKCDIGDEHPHRFDYADRDGIIEDLFKKRKTVSYKAVADWMKRKHGFMGDVRVSGGQGETGFESKLSSYNDFCDLLEVEYLGEKDARMAEEIILWNTLFEDRAILKRRIQQSYGERLSSEQIKKICKKRYTGWGRLSRELLSGIKSPTDNGPKCIMDILYEGDQNNGRVGSAMNLMEILHDDRYTFMEQIDEHNKAVIKENGRAALEEMPGSPALRRSINQALRVVDEIVSIAGKPPKNIFVEVTRDDDLAKRGRRTTRRYDKIKDALAVFKKEDPEIYQQLRDSSSQSLADDRLALYFMQRGKCMYSGRSLDINRLSSYHVDHIIPQSYIKDDSLDNKVLVLQEENERKLDSLLIDDSIRRRMKGYWSSLHDAGLMSDKKFNNLMRSSISQKQLKGFINRQLVETSQIVKLTADFLSDAYSETKVVPVKASLSSSLRERCGFAKCREINDYHHAHDAYIACRLGAFIQMRHGAYIDQPIKMEKAIRAFIKSQGEEYKVTKRTPGQGGFFVSSFMKSGFSKETGEIFRDTWDAEAEIARMRKCLSYRDCFISRMPEITSGAFWNATVYSPRGNKQSNPLPLKRNLDPAKYGSYDTEQFAYFFVYEAIDKKGRHVARFSPIPVSVAAGLEQPQDGLISFARGDAAKNELEFVRILREKIYKYQLIEWEGNRLYISGIKEARNAAQLAFSQEETRLVRRLADGEEIDEQQLDGLLREVVTKMKHYSPRLAGVLKIENTEACLDDIGYEEKANLLLALVAICCGKRKTIDTTCCGGSKHAGRIASNYSKLLLEATLIDQSVTGMLERRTRIKLEGNEE